MLSIPKPFLIEIKSSKTKKTIPKTLSSIESSSDDPDDNNDNNENNSIISSIDGVQDNSSVSNTSSLRNNKSSRTTPRRAETSLLRRMRLAASELDSESGDYVAAANVVKSCAEALYAIRKIQN